MLRHQTLHWPTSVSINIYIYFFPSLLELKGLWVERVLWNSLYCTVEIVIIALRNLSNGNGLQRSNGFSSHQCRDPLYIIHWQVLMQPLHKVSLKTDTLPSPKQHISLLCTTNYSKVHSLLNQFILSSGIIQQKSYLLFTITF